MIKGARASGAGGQRLLRNSSELLRLQHAATDWSVVGLRRLSSGSLGARRDLSSFQGASPVAAPAAKALPSYVLNCPETEVTTLPNGLRVASEVMYPVRSSIRQVDTIVWVGEEE